MSEEQQYIVPNRAEPLTIIASNPINQNWELIEDAINVNYDLAYNAAEEVENKVDKSSVAVENGIASLDSNTKLIESQLPDKAIGQVFSVDTISSQLELNAHSGDVCVRTDIGKTYALQAEPASSFQNWLEIASVDAGGEVGANPCYVNNFKEDFWISDLSHNRYYLRYSKDEHLQGTTKFLLVEIKKLFSTETETYSKKINCDYDISDEGDINLYSDVPFNGSIMISNLSGNTKNSQYFPYAIMTGPENNGNPNLLSAYTAGRIYINYNTPTVLVDGLGIVRKINSGVDFEISDIPTDTYVLFIDSVDIEDAYVLDFHYIKKSDYLGLVNQLPSTGTTGQRCYVKYDESYEYQDGWKSKAFVPIGEFTFDLRITGITNYPYRDNGMTVNASSTYFDYLFGSKLEGLQTNIDENLVVNSGRCFGNNNLITLTSTITKNLNENWSVGDNQGCLDDSFENTYIAYEVIKDDTLYYTAEENPSPIGEEDVYVEAGIEVFEDSALTTLYKTAEELEFKYTGNTISNTEQNYGWGKIYLIYKYDRTDVIISLNDNITLPAGYIDYKLIGYFYRDALGFHAQKDFNKKTYLVNPIILTSLVYEVQDSENTYYTNIPDSNSFVDEDENSYVEAGVMVYEDKNLTIAYKEAEEYEFSYTNNEFHISNLNIDGIGNNSLILTITNSENDEITITNDGIMVYSTTENKSTVEVPNNSVLNNENCTVALLGYINEELR